MIRRRPKGAPASSGGQFASNEREEAPSGLASSGAGVTVLPEDRTSAIRAFLILEDRYLTIKETPKRERRLLRRERRDPAVAAKLDEMTRDYARWRQFSRRFDDGQETPEDREFFEREWTTNELFGESAARQDLENAIRQRDAYIKYGGSPEEHARAEESIRRSEEVIRTRGRSSAIFAQRRLGEMR